MIYHKIKNYLFEHLTRMFVISNNKQLSVLIFYDNQKDKEIF